MKKRQKKKNQKKYIPVYMDEASLWFMTVEERVEFIAAIKKFREKYAFRKKYYDLKNATPFIMSGPLPSKTFIQSVQTATKKIN